MTRLEVRGVSKSYKSYRSEIYRFAEWFGLSGNTYNESLILKNICFSLSEGESLGVVGNNGAGKSTLLKIITGTVAPTSGGVEVNGAISSILELGLGFNMELTGRQNAHHVASIAGLSGKDLNKVVDSAYDFSEVGDYFDQPMRVYSSGMQMRVAFSIITAKRPDILLVDEAFSVGDAYFQHKSFDRIRAFRKSGTILILVSHDRNAILNICDRAILLEEGKITKDSKPEIVLDYYNASLSVEGDINQYSAEGEDAVKTHSGTGEASVVDIKLLNQSGQEISTVSVGELCTLEFRVHVREKIEQLVLGVGIKDRLGQVLFGTNTWHTKQIIKEPEVGSFLKYRFNFHANFNVGSYSVQTALVDTDTHYNKNYEWRDYALMFEVLNASKPSFIGSQWLDSSFDVVRS